jgi:acyl-CoA synthetase (AMP-forming)/AMP-acid ligase II
MIFRSSLPDVTIPEGPLTQVLLEAAAKRPDKAAFIDGSTGRVLTFGDWATAVKRGAHGLAARGFKKGDVFAIYSHNCPEYAVAFHAVALAGGIVTTINPTYTVEELQSQLLDCRARFLLTVPAFLAKAQEAGERAGIEEIFLLGQAPGVTPFSALLEKDGLVPDVKIDPREDLVALPYSSGTTGLPKGVMLTHYNLVANMYQARAAFASLSESDVIAGVLPFFHIYGLVVIMNEGMLIGATVVTMPRFELEPFLEVLQKYAVTIAYVVPPIALALAKHPAVDKYDLSKLRIVFSGAAPLGEAVTHACRERLKCIVSQGYGMTETSPATHTSPPEPERIKPGTVGPPIPNTECKIVDLLTGRELGPGDLGEVCMRGPQIMKGYLNRPEATAAMIDEDGWLHSGDIGFAEPDGTLHVVDRVKELIKYKGMQVAPAEIEAVLLSHPAVADAAVVPSPDEEAGEVPKAFLVLKGEATTEEIQAWVAERVAPHKRLRRVEIIGQIPKSLSGKILRRVLVQQERERRETEAKPS